MSMKRSKPVSRGPRDNEGEEKSYFAKKAAPPTPTFEANVASQPDTAFVAYSPATRFAQGALVLHPKFGRGVVTTVEGARIEVLFEDGSKKLGHGA